MNFLSKQQENAQNKISEFKDILQASGVSELANKKSELGLGCRYKHTFCNGLYIREMFIPAGLYIVTKIHKTLHPYFVMSGEVSVYSEEGIEKIKGPLYGITKPGTRRALHTISDTIWITIHATDETDIEKIGNNITADDFNDLDLESLENQEVKVIEEEK